MKGIAHFLTGLAWASCFPSAVQAALEGHAGPMVLGGICGLIPDTLDFKIGRFFFRHDIEVTPDPLQPDPALIARAVAWAIDRAGSSGRPVKIKLNTIRLSANEWLPYRVILDPGARRVAVRIGSPISTGGSVLPCLPAICEGMAPVACAFSFEYQAETAVEILEGPMLAMVPHPGGRVRIEFLPWHRTWSHSVLVALICAAGGYLVAGGVGSLIAGGACMIHALGDMPGHLGGAWGYPFQRKRSPGWRLMHSGDPLINIATVWGACLWIFWNLARLAPVAWPPYLPAKLFFFGWLIPLGFAWSMRKRQVARSRG